MEFELDDKIMSEEGMTDEEIIALMEKEKKVAAWLKAIPDPSPMDERGGFDAEGEEGFAPLNF
jgi:hypothetical protein